MSTTAITRQEIPGPLLQGRFDPGIFPLPVRPPTDQSTFTTREQPDHLYARTGISLAGPPVRPPTDQRAITVREQPGHPLPGYDRGVAPKSVRPPTDQSTLGRQEQPPYYRAAWAVGPVANARVPVTDCAYQAESRPAPTGYSFVRPSLQGPNVRIYVTDSVLQVRQQPDHPGPRTSAGPYGHNIRPAIVDVVLLRQATPDHLQPLTRPSLPGPSIRQLNDRVFVVQTLPDHPLPRYQVGVQGPNIRPLNDRILLGQQQPDHPGPRLFGPHPLVPPTSLVSARIFLVQVQPEHPNPRYLSGVQGPDIRPVTDRVLIAQQLPDHPLPRTNLGVQGPNVALRVTDRVWSGQQPPDFVLPVTWTGIVTLRLPPRATGDRVIVEQVFTGAGAGTIDTGVLTIFRPGPPGLAFTASLEPPPVIAPTTLAGVPGRAVGVVQGYLHVPPVDGAQPLPPAVLSGGFGPDVMPPVYRVILVQEQPDTPTLSLAAGLAGPDVVAPLLGIWSFQQQYPTDHPTPSTAIGPYNIVLRRLQLIFDWMGSAGIVDDNLEPS